jgi:DUF4097 and DUF4098 domain-containing protein YvlB
VQVADVALEVGRVAGSADVKSGSGMVRIGELDGAAIVKSARSTVTIGKAGGERTIATTDGDVDVDHAEASVTARTANGSIRVGDVARGRIDLATGTGDVEVGIRVGSAAWVDAFSKYGSVRNQVPSREGPKDFAEKAEVRARTQTGDIDIRPAPQPAPA